jgi:hypothetical protein
MESQINNKKLANQISQSIRLYDLQLLSESYQYSLSNYTPLSLLNVLAADYKM